MKNGLIDIQINYKDRPSELGMLLESLRKQSYQKFHIYVMDDQSGTPLQNYYFITMLIMQLKLEGHRVNLIRNEISKGVSFARQKLVDHILEFGDGEFICRLDDDTILEPDYLERLMEVIKEGYDLASGVTPPFGAPMIERSTKYVKPFINRVVLDGEGKFLINCDDCGYLYLEKEIIPTHHFRSCALYRRSVHDKVNYEDHLTVCGFREEEFFSMRMILNGFKLGVHTGAIAWHLRTPSGGDRRQDYSNLAVQNQRLLNRFMKRKYKEHGDFITKYNEKFDVEDSTPLASIDKNSNLLFNMED